MLSLNEASWQVLRGERAVQVGESVKPARGRRAGKAVVTGDGDDALFEALRTLRKRLADEAGMPPYIVFNDASLRDMAQRQPTTLEEFATIAGVGQAKLARYGKRVRGADPDSAGPLIARQRSCTAVVCVAAIDRCHINLTDFFTAPSSTSGSLDKIFASDQYDPAFASAARSQKIWRRAITEIEAARGSLGSISQRRFHPGPLQPLPTWRSIMRVERDWLRNLIFDGEEARRFTQDSAILPDVWLAGGMFFCRDPKARVDLLLTPYKGYSSSFLARLPCDVDSSISAAPWSLRSDSAIFTVDAARASGPSILRLDARVLLRPTWSIAVNQTNVAVALTLEELIAAVLPLSDWWTRNIATGDQSRSASAQVSWLRKVVGVMALCSHELSEPRKRTCHVARKPAQWMRSTRLDASGVPRVPTRRSSTVSLATSEREELSSIDCSTPRPASRASSRPPSAHKSRRCRSCGMWGSTAPPSFPCSAQCTRRRAMRRAASSTSSARSCAGRSSTVASMRVIPRSWIR